MPKVTTVAPPISEDKREIFGWQMYDWAWSAFSTTVVTALLGPYLFELAEDNGGVDVFGFVVDEGSFFPICLSLVAFLQVLILPIIGSVADHTDHRKPLMLGLSYFGSVMTAGLFFVTGERVIAGGVLFILAGIGFGASSVIYNSYLGDIAAPENRDRVSSEGFALGYLGGGLWLGLNFALITVMSDNVEMAVRLSLGGSGIWALLFILLFPQRRIRSRPAKRAKPQGQGWFGFSTKSVLHTLVKMRSENPVTFRYLIAYLVFNDGIQTVIAVASTFSADELDVEASTLLLVVLLIQFLAIPGALVFGRYAGRIGAKKALSQNLVVWLGIVVYAYAALDSEAKLWVLAVPLALVLGGSQALARSLFSQMIPTSSEAEYFGFFEIAARGTSWLGPAAFAVVNQITGSQRQAILSLIIFFILGLGLLIGVDVRKGMDEANQDPGDMVL